MDSVQRVFDDAAVKMAGDAAEADVLAVVLVSAARELAELSGRQSVAEAFALIEREHSDAH